MGQWITDILKKKYPNIQDKFITVGGGISKEFDSFTNNKPNNKKILFCGINNRIKVE